MPDESQKKAKKEAWERVLLPSDIGLFRHYHYKLQKIELEKDYDRVIQNQPIEFKFYCQYCLHQTNEHAENCPKCEEGRLVETGREPV